MDSALTNDLQEQAREAERDLLSTIDALAARRRQLSFVVSQAWKTLEAGALVLSALFVLGATAAFRRPRRAVRPDRAPFGVRTGVLLLVGASVGLLAMGRRTRGRRAVAFRRAPFTEPVDFPHAMP